MGHFLLVFCDHPIERSEPHGSIRVEVWGDYACFSRPEMKVERVSYDVMTPSAARRPDRSRLLASGSALVIDRIHVCAPIRFTNIRRNEVKDA
ncbi:MAG: CRISPR-associated protein Cas5 [Oscillospiraceae bacterium]